MLCKATPVLVVVGLWLAGRRRLAGIAAALTAAVVALSGPTVGLEAWDRFLAISWRIGRTVITDWGNVSADATLLRLATGAGDSVFRQSSGVPLVGAWILRVTLVLLACWQVLRSEASSARRISAAWIAWMAATPLLWLHYLSVLVPLFASTSMGPRSRHAPLLLTAGLSAVLVARVAGVNVGAVGSAGGLVWLTSASWLLSHAAWDRRDAPPAEM